MKMRGVILFMLSVLLFDKAYCQVNKKPVQPPVSAKQTPFVPKTKFFAVARAAKNEILIRWAAADYGGWDVCNKYGFAIEKYTIVKNNKLLEKFERSQPKMVIKPKPLAEWDSLVNNDDYAAVMAQAMYGEDFDVTMGNKSGVGAIINETQKNDQRYNMSMYGADHSYKAATFAALGYTDKNVKSGEKYFYRIYSMVPAGTRKMDTATIYIGLADYKPLPKTSDIIIEPGDKSMMLKWDFETNKEYYTSYIIERSGDGGKTFINITDKPVTQLNNAKDAPGLGSILYIDSLSNNDTIYQYRIAGVSLFGDNGPYSDMVKGKGKNMLSFTPGITSASRNEKGQYFLHWQLQDSVDNLIKEFKINQSEFIDGTYKVYKQNIPAAVRSMMVDSLYSSNYFTITAVSNEGQEKTSLPYLLQPEDSIAPATPVGFAAKIDTNGIVTLSWKPNTENDFDGYRVFKTNVKGHELIALVDTLFKTTEIKDTTNLKSLNSKLYYTITAVDRRYNQSAYAPLIEVIKPDIVPPSQPVLAGYDISDDGIKINWINSTDEDVVMHKLYRKPYQGGAWELLETFRGKSISQVIDKKGEEGKTYSYTIIAVDSAKLESEPAIPLTVVFPEKRIKTAIKSLDAEVDRDKRMITLAWAKIPDVKNIKQFELYRGDDKRKMSLYKVFEENVFAFTDNDLTVNTRYKYGVRVVFANGKYSDFITKNVIY